MVLKRILIRSGVGLALLTAAAGAARAQPATSLRSRLEAFTVLPVPA